VAEEGAGFESASSCVVILDQQLVEFGLAGGQHPPQVGAAKAAARAAPGREGDLVESPTTGACERQQPLEWHVATDAHADEDARHGYGLVGRRSISLTRARDGSRTASTTACATSSA